MKTCFLTDIKTKTMAAFTYSATHEQEGTMQLCAAAKCLY